MATRREPYDEHMCGGSNARADYAPWSLLKPHVDRGWCFLLDRAGSAEPSFSGSLPSSVLVVAGDGSCTRTNAAGVHAVAGNPIDVIDEYIAAAARRPRSLPSWLSPDSPLPRTVGYLAYELGAFIERVPRVEADPVGAPLAVLATYDRVDAWHPATGRTAPIVFEESRPVSLEALMRPAHDAGSRSRARSNDDRSSYMGGFQRIAAAIEAGDIYQANLSRRLTFQMDARAADVYERLRRRQPVPHGAYLDMGAWQILSNSPECFLRVDGEVVRTFPIKGTRPRAIERSRDRALARELAGDEKERAEHLMIVDLERNDLGRVCRTGSVAVPAFAEVASFATVHHLVSEVRGCLRSDATLADLLRATFPGGSITGAPKIRSMEVIAEVEDTARGVYTGTIGFLNGPRSMELAIAIRTAVATGSTLHYSSGGGIVADSSAENEWEETVTKSRAFADIAGGTSRRRAG